jgi:hypothetical protein
MATFTWLGGSVGLGQGRYGNPSDWVGGAAAPGPGDTAAIAGLANTGIQRIGALYTFPIGSGWTLAEFFPPQPGLTLQDDPNAIVGDTVQDQAIAVDGTAGAAALWLENSHLVNDSVSVVGTAVLSSYLDSTVSGAITVGAASAPGYLQVVPIPYDTALIGPSDHHPVTTFDAAVTINAGSTLEVESGAAGGVSGWISNGAITVAPGGTLIVDDTDDPTAGVNTGGVFSVGNHDMVFGNGGSIAVQGAPGRTTGAVLLADTTGPGSITIDGHGAARTATALTVDGYLQKQLITLSDGTVTVNDATAAVGDPGQAGFDVTGGAFTFADGSGTLVLHQAPLTSLQFNSTDTDMVETPDGRTPFTTPISGFGAGDVIALPGKDLGYYGSTYATTYDRATGVLQVISPASIAGDPPAVLAALTLIGPYDPALFHVGGDTTTEELDITYAGPAPAVQWADTATGARGTSPATAYTGPLSYLQQQYLWGNADSVAVTADVPNVFLRGGPGDDALSARAGSNVLDGNTGSNFLVGSTGADGGTDTFFTDARGSAVVWNTLGNVHTGDSATLWGFDPTVSTWSWAGISGAGGYTGATLRADVHGTGTIDASITFAGLSMAQAQGLQVSTGSAGGVGYLYLHDPGV